MEMNSRCLRACPRRNSSALVIVLAFVVLLSALVFFFFGEAMNHRMLANTGFNDFKSETLAQSALQVVVADLTQEIANGSTATTYGTGTNISTVYIPTTNLYAVPQRSGNPALAGGLDPIPNLIRRSIRSDAIASPGVVSRASAVNSTTDPALGGQYVSLARWNKHLLIPRDSSASGTTNLVTTPISAFTAPDWVYVTSQGPKVLITPANSNTIGRYAYAIYDEGGLLDANVAGFPSGTVTNATSHPTPDTYKLLTWGAGLKGPEAFADLTVPVTNAAGASAPMLTQLQIDQLVGWRNSATAQPTGNFTDGYTFNASSALLYHDAVVSNTNGFLVTSGQTWTGAGGTTVTDSAFTSRQSLIQFFKTENFPLDSLQYFATFTRTLEQPTYVPPVGRPQVQSSATANAATFGTGNDAYGSDRTATPSMDINPPFLSVRVTNSFTRSDGTVALVGDPLIKKRFPLSRLSLFPVNQGAVSGTVATQIYNYFGLTQVSGGVWSYNHGNSTGIYRLSQVAAQGREPDFFELLKAGINVGSVGKGSFFNGDSVDLASKSPSAGYLQQARDTQSQLQILQIGANIIDQSKADDYPTQIYFSGASTYIVRGVEDLPYLYRFRNWIMREGTTGTLGVVLFQPELWNPHSPGSSTLVPAGSMPKNFRVRVALDTLSSSKPFSLLEASYADSALVDVTSASGFNTGVMPQPLTFNAGEANGYWGFREPTLLAQIGKPATSNFSTDSTNIFTDYPSFTPDPSRKMTGFLVVTFPWNDPANATASVAQKFYTGQNGASSAMHFYLDCEGPSGWITYDDQVVQPYTSVEFITKFANTSAGYSTTANVVTFQEIPYSAFGGAGRTDPRTSRWGFYIANYLNYIPAVTTGPEADTSPDPVVWGTYRPNGGISFGDHIGGRADLGFTYNGSTYLGASYGYQGFQHGYWAENSIRTTYQTDTGDNTLRFNRDPDGVVRRAMGGYVTDPTEGGTASSASQPLTGLPLATGAITTPQYGNRPTMLHRPFRSVAELGYVFRDTPWGNINFTFPESGDSPLLDLFCINPASDPNGMVAGRVNLNTRQAPVLAALMSNTILDKDDTTNPVLTQIMASDLAKQLVARTSNPNSISGYGPLSGQADLVGTWIGPTTPAAAQTALKVTAPDPDTLYTGFSHDIGTAAVPSVNSTPTVALIPRQRNSVMRGMVDSGTTRTWNLLIDLVAQSGRFPPTASSLAKFVVEGEKHYWLHVAIDRYTGKVIDSQLEVVRE